MNKFIERQCILLESLAQSCKEMKSIREGKLAKKNWRGLFSDLKKEDTNKIKVLYKGEY